MIRMPSLIAMLLGALLFLGAPPAAAQTALEEFEGAMMNGAYEKAVLIAEQLAHDYPNSSTAAYNCGCACSRAGHADRSIEWLLKAASLGYSGIRSIRDDEDLGPVRSHARYAEVTAAVQANVDARFDAFKAEAGSSPPHVVMPKKYDPDVPSPLLIVLHGTGGNGKGMVPFFRQAAERCNAILVAPDALRPVRGSRGYSWVYRDEAEWLVTRIIKDAREKWNVGPVILVGFSQGANIALMLGQSHADLFHAVIPICGHYESDVAELPTEDPRPRWCLLMGERDPWAQTYDVAKKEFEGAGMIVRHEVVPNIGHAIPTGSKGKALLLNVLQWSLREQADAVAPDTDSDEDDGDDGGPAALRND